MAANAADPFSRLLCRDHDQHLAPPPASSLARSWPAYEYLIHFDDTLQPLTSRTNHRPAQLVQQIPRRVIAPQSQYPLQALGAASVFLASHVPEHAASSANQSRNSSTVRGYSTMTQPQQIVPLESSA
jgi:hypothetical protein